VIDGLITVFGLVFLFALVSSSSALSAVRPRYGFSISSIDSGRPGDILYIPFEEIDRFDSAIVGHVGSDIFEFVGVSNRNRADAVITSLLTVAFVELRGFSPVFIEVVRSGTGPFTFFNVFFYDRAEVGRRHVTINDQNNMVMAVALIDSFTSSFTGVRL